MSERDEESISTYSTGDDRGQPEINRGQREDESFSPPKRILRKFRSYLHSAPDIDSLPLHHQQDDRHRFQSEPNVNDIERSDTMSANRIEQWESHRENGSGHAPRTNSTRTENDLPSMSQQQQQDHSKRRKRSLAGKVRDSVSKPARAVGRRVFKNRYSSKVGVLGGRGDVGLSRDISDQTPDNIFRSNPLDRDASRMLSGGNNNTPGRTSTLRRSISRMLSTGSAVSRAPIASNANNKDPTIPTAFASRESEDTDWPVRSVESFARNAALLCAAYVLGASYPEWSASVSRILEFTLTAWVTCLVILLLGWLRNSDVEDHPEYVSPYTDYQKLWQWQGQDGDPEMMPLIEHRGSGEQQMNGYGASTSTDAECATNENHYGENKLSLSTDSAIPPESQNEASIVGSTSSIDETERSFAKNEQLPQTHYETLHPSLFDFFVVDSKTGERVVCNGTPYRISTEWFEMDMLAMIRTPDTDDPSATRGTAQNDKVSQHFRPHARRFEFQYQVRLKKRLPIGKQLYFACEVEEPVKLGIVTKAFVSAAMAFVRQTNPTFHYNLAGSKKKPADGKWETAHMAFTVEAGLDRLVVTKPGETPPELGSKIYEDPESMKRRKNGELTDWNTEDTYTLSLWSSYMNFLEWRVQNLPGIKPFSLASILGVQPVNLTMYLIDANADGDHHYRKDLEEVINFELSSKDHSGLGKLAKKWIDARTPGNAVPGTPTGQPIGHCLSEDSAGLDESVKSPVLGASDTMDEIDEIEIDNDAADAAELGEGIYLRSGDSVLLREFLSDDEKGTACTVVNGGGFAVLSKRNVPIVIEKTKRSKKNKLIKSGDTVMFKMIQMKPGTDDLETRYLTLHRGWWLKWVTSPSKAGYFEIYTHETELGEKELPTDETQSAFLTLGGSFTLRHRRRSRFTIGALAEPSIDFGGRMLSLYKSERNKGGLTEEERQQSMYPSEDEGELDKEMPSIGKPGWAKPLVLCTVDPQGLIATSPKSPKKSIRFDDNNQEKVEPQTPKGLKLQFSREHSYADVPAWIEMMDRQQRVRQLAYVVRVIHVNSDAPATNQEETFTRLKSGRDLARILKIGQSLKLPQVAPKRLASTVSASATSAADTTNVGSSIVKSNSDPSLSGKVLPGGSGEGEDGLAAKINTSVSTDDMPSANEGNLTKLFSADELPVSDESGDGDEVILTRMSASSDGLGGNELLENLGIEVDKDLGITPSNSLLDDESIDGDSVSDSSVSDTEDRRQRKRSLQKLKKLGKNTGKLAAKGLRGSGKVVQSTGKKLRGSGSRKPGKQPRREPRKNKNKNRDPQKGIKRKMKRLERKEAKSGGPPIFLAGELSATEQSRRTASRILERMSVVPMQSSAWQRCNEALSSELGFATDQDTWFLDGDAMHLGIKPSNVHGKLLFQNVVARCLWESHWREEWCGMYESSLAFYDPLAKSACHEIYYSDVTLVRPLVEDGMSPLPGFSVLVIETAWQCHYMAFRNDASRDAFGEKVDLAVKSFKAKQQKNSLESNELQKARLWQGFQTLSETSLAAGAAKWAKVSCNQKAKERAILNGRRMAFDGLTSISFEGSASKAYEFVENLLTRALTFSFTTLEQDPESFIDFLDLTSELRFLPLEEIDLSSPNAFCMFVNIYHCLLQQAMLLSVNGPLHKKSIIHFMRTSCYEIGGDVFSLAELHSYVICGKMSKPINPKPPYVDAPKKSNAYKYYALDYTDVRVHFVLNTADMACPASVPVLSQRTIEAQLNAGCADFFCNKQLFVDTRRRIITLPKVCEIRKNDFGIREILNVLRLCLGEMDEADGYLGMAIREVIEKGGRGLTIRFQNTQEQYHSSLRLTTAAADRNLELDYYDGILESISTEQEP